MTREQLVELADDLGIEPKKVATAVALMRTGRADLIVEVMNSRLSVGAALAAAREGKKS
jgi:predicted PhzF superfamily epimerase YddE/YHI9